MLTTQGNLDPHRLQAVAVGTSANDAAQKNKKLGDSRIEIMVTKKNPPLMDSADH
jgi:hypothetical protein